MRSKVIILNGTATVGKDTFADAILEYHGSGNDRRGIKVSTVDCIKKAARESFEWNDEKTDHARLFLHQLKTNSTIFNDFSFRKTIEKVDFYLKLFSEVAAFIVCREPDDIRRYVNYYGDNAVTVLISREEAEENMPTNAADQEVFDYQYDYIIENIGDIEQFKKTAIFFYKNLYKIADFA